MPQPNAIWQAPNVWRRLPLPPWQDDFPDDRDLILPNCPLGQSLRPTLNKIVTGQYVASAAVTDVPYIVGMKVINGVMTWKIQVPLKVTFRNGDQASTEDVIWQIVVQRVNNAESNQLVGISQVVQTVGGQ